jgi:GGDEF domain-containing protein
VSHPRVIDDELQAIVHGPATPPPAWGADTSVDDEFDRIARGPGTKPPPTPATTDDFDAIASAPPAVRHIQGRGRTVEAPARIDEPSAPPTVDPMRPSLPVRIAQQVEGMAEPFRPKNLGEQAIPFAATGRGLAETAVGIAKQTAQSMGTALSPVVGEESRVNLRAPTPSVPGSTKPHLFTKENGAVTERERNIAGLQLTALAVAGPLGELTTGVSAPFLGKAASKVVGGMTAGAPVGASYSPEDPLAGAGALALVGGALAPLHATEHDVPVVSRPPEFRQAVELAQVKGIPDPEPVAAPVVEPPTSATRTRETSQETETARLRQERDEARRAAETSPTTGQPNKLALRRALPAAEADPNTAVVRADINGLKNVNDAPGLGHDYADQYVLRRAATAMKAAADEVGVPDRSFHPDGDQFVALVPKEKAETYRDALERNYGVVDHGNGIRSSISAGIGDTSPEADAEMYQRKADAKVVQGISNGRETPAANVATVPTSSLSTDPARFQYKQGANNETGSVGSLSGVRAYNPELAGVLSVWKDPADGQTFVVNGHNRLDLALRTNTPTVDVRYLSAPDAETARAKGALINIAEGQGTPLDAAKFFRDTGGDKATLEATGVRVSGGLAEKGLAIAKLPDSMFQDVYTGRLPEDVAVGIGKVLDTPEQQLAAAHLIVKSGRTLSPGEIANVARQVRDAGSISVQGEDLFGAHDQNISLAVSKARLAESFRKDFAKETSLFGFVSKEGRAEQLAKAGNTIDLEGSRARAISSAQAEEMFDRLSTRSGPISDILSEGARRLEHGERLTTVKADIGERLRSAIQEDVARGMAGRDGRGEGDVSERTTPSSHEAGTDAGPATGSSAPEEVRRVADSHDQAQSPLFGEPAPRRSASRSIATARTGEPFEQRVLRGSGRADSPYNELGAQVPILGEGRYGTSDRGYAESFGPNVTEHTARLENPLVIDSDAAWRKLTKDVGWQYPNPFGQDPAKVEADISQLRRILEARGHDGVVVRVPNNELTGKTLQNVFGADQVIEFNPSKQAPLFARTLFGEEEPEEPTQGGLFPDKEGTINLRSTAQIEGAMRAEIPGLEYRVTHSTSFLDRQAAARRLAEIQRTLNRNEKIGAEEIRNRIRGGNDQLFGSVVPESGPVRSEQVPTRAPLDSQIPTERQAAAALFAKDARGDVGLVSGTETPVEKGRRLDTLRSGNRLWDSIKRALAPATRSRAAELTGQIITEHTARAAFENERILHALKEASLVFGKLDDASRMDFLYAVDEGRPTHPALQGFANSMRTLLDALRVDIQNLGTGKLRTFYKDYFPRIFADPEQAAKSIGEILTKRSMEGGKSFLKPRTHVTLREAIEAGNTLLSTNPIDLLMLKAHEMNRYIAGVRIEQEMKAHGLDIVLDARSQPPQGWTRIEGPEGIVYGDPRMHFSEAFDKLAREKVEALIEKLGMQHVRTAKMPGSGVLGFYERGGNITTRAATPLDVLYHEFGHGLDEKYGLWQAIRDPFDKATAPRGPRGGTPRDTPERIAGRKVIDQELRALADKRYEGQEVSANHKQYVRTKQEKMAVIVQAYLHAPALFRETAPTVASRFEQFIDQHSDLHAIRDIKPSLVHDVEVHEQRVNGLVISGYHYEPDGAALVRNNFLSPGIRANRTYGPIYEAFRGVGNVMTQAQLGMSAFHLGFTAMDTAISQNALGLKQLLAPGERLRGLTNLAQGSIPGVSQARALINGNRLMREALQGDRADPIVEALIQGGARLHMQTDYRIGAMGKLWKVLEDAQKLQASPTRGGFLRAPLLPVRAGFHLMSAIIEAATYPIMEYAVPRMKLSVAADMLAYELRQMGPGTGISDVRAAHQAVVRSVENRMGQLTYDNLFWDRTLKDLSQLAVRSVGWNVGLIREVPGGMVDIARVPQKLLAGETVARAVSHKAVYVASAVATTALYGAIYQYLRTGSGPQSMKDYFWPRTGQVNADGTDERKALPTYLKDAHAFSIDPLKTVTNKANPVVGTVVDMLTNRDWQKNEIRNPDDPLVLQLQQEADYLRGQFTPFGIQNFQKSRREGQSPSDQAQNFLGIIDAPKDVVREPWQQKMAEFTGALTPGGLTPEQVQQRNQRRQLTSDVRQQRTGAVDSLFGTMRRGEMSPRSATQVLKSGLTSSSSAESFKRLTAEQAVTVYNLMPDSVREEFRGRLLVKISNARRAGRMIEIPPSAVR